MIIVLPFNFMLPNETKRLIANYLGDRQAFVARDGRAIKRYYHLFYKYICSRFSESTAGHNNVYNV